MPNDSILVISDMITTKPILTLRMIIRKMDKIISNGAYENPGTKPNMLPNRHPKNNIIIKNKI